MTDNFTLIESEILDELLEKALYYDIIFCEMNNLPMYEIDYIKLNKDVATRKANFLSKYIDVPINLDETLADKLEQLGYE